MRVKGLDTVGGKIHRCINAQVPKVCIITKVMRIVPLKKFDTKGLVAQLVSKDSVSKRNIQHQLKNSSNLSTTVHYAKVLKRYKVILIIMDRMEHTP